MSLKKMSEHCIALVARVPNFRKLAFLCFVLSAPAHAAVTYSYTGNFFNSVEPPYTTSHRITGSFSVAVVLPPFLDNVDISDLLTAMRFQDGVQVRTPGNSDICRFVVTTDGNGRLLNWAISLRQSQVTPGNPIQVLDTTDTFDQSGVGTAPSQSCATLSLNSSSSAPGPGQWNVNLPMTQPTSYSYAGTTYQTAPPPYNLSQRLNGSITLQGPLPPFMPMRSIAPFLTDFLFNDGIQIRNPSNTQICGMEVSTDGAGHINAWIISLRQKVFTQGNPQQIIDSTHFGDSVGTGLAGPLACSPVSFNLLACSKTPGNWSDSLPAGLPTDYEYTGLTFQDLLQPYQVGDQLTGYFSFANPLPPYLSQFDLSPALDDFQFQDGIQTRTPLNSEICQLSVSTGSEGEIVQWNISLRETPFTPNLAQFTIDSNTLQDLVGSGPAGMTACSFLGHNTFAISYEGGSWTAPNGTPEPAVYIYSGRRFTSAQPPFTTRQKIAGRLVLPGLLPPNLQITDVVPHVIDFRFYDGQQVRSAINSQICEFEVSTDSMGTIVGWTLFLRQVVAPSMVQFTLSSSSKGIISSDQGGVGLAGASVCSSINLNTSGETQLKGQWFELCPSLRANFPLWPESRNVLDLIAASCL